MNPKLNHDFNFDELHENSINRLLRYLFHEHFLAFNEKFHSKEEFEGMGMGHQRVIMHMLHHEGVSQSDIAKDSNISRATVHETIKKMEEKGLVEKVKKGNKRKIKLFLTQSGRELKEPIKEMFDEVQQVVLDGFSDVEIDQLKDFLIRMIQNLKTHRNDHSNDDDSMKKKIIIIEENQNEKDNIDE